MESECCKLCFVQTRDRIKDRKNLKSEANFTVKRYLVDLTHQNGVNEETASRYYQVGYLCNKCSNLVRKVIKLEDELQKNLSELKQRISSLDLHQSRNTHSGSEDQAPQRSSSAQLQSQLIPRKRGPCTYKPPAKRLNFEQNPPLLSV